MQAQDKSFNDDSSLAIKYQTLSLQKIIKAIFTIEEQLEKLVNKEQMKQGLTKYIQQLLATKISAHD